VNYLVAAHTQSITTVQYFIGLLVLAVFAGVGAVLVFDLFGFVSKYGIPPSRRTVERMERYGLPNPHKIVGGAFLLVGGLFFVFAVIAGIIGLILDRF
jgi:hypothetical protein